jgi:hypothetical protein
LQEEGAGIFPCCRFCRVELLPVADELANLIDSFELLKPTLGDYIKRRFIQNPYYAYRTLMGALASQCCIRGYQLLEGNGGLDGAIKKVRPSLRLLVDPFLEKNENKYSWLLEKLKSGPPERPDVVGSLENGLLAMALRKSQKIEIGSGHLLAPFVPPAGQGSPLVAAVDPTST